VNAYWITYIAGETGSGASYTAPVNVAAGAATSAPADPVWTGYSFDGWFEEPDTTFTEEETGTAFKFGGTLDSDITLYAHWTATQSSYTIQFWQQKVSDDKDAAENGTETYDFVAATFAEAKVGTSVSVPNSYKRYDGQTAVTIEGVNYSFYGFHYDECDAAKTVNAAGTTVLNVYYNRDVMTLNFWTGNYDATLHTMSGDIYLTKQFNLAKSLQGLYGSSLADAEEGWSWPSDYLWRYKCSSMTDHGRYYYYPDGTACAYLDAFIFSDGGTPAICIRHRLPTMALFIMCCRMRTAPTTRARRSP